MRVGHGNTVGIDRRFRLDAVFPDIAVRHDDVDDFGFFRSRYGGGIIRRHRRATHDAALRSPGAGAAGERFQQSRGAAGGGSGKLIVADVDGPDTPADRNAGQRRLIVRFQPALGGGGMRRKQQQRASAQAGQHKGRNLAVRAHWGAVLGCARSIYHLGKNIRQTTRDFRKSLPRDLIRGARRRNPAPETHDVGGECAVYMMAGDRRMPAKPAFCRAQGVSKP